MPYSKRLDATPNYFFTVSRPSDHAVLRTAFTAAEKLGQRTFAAVFSFFRFHRFLGRLSLFFFKQKTAYEIDM